MDIKVPYNVRIFLMEKNGDEAMVGINVVHTVQDYVFPLTNVLDFTENDSVLVDKVDVIRSVFINVHVMYNVVLVYKDFGIDVGNDNHENTVYVVIGRLIRLDFNIEVVENTGM